MDKTRKITSSLSTVLFLLAGVTAEAYANQEPMTLEQIVNVVKNEVDGQRSLDYVAYPYLGWRTNGGAWFNAVEDWLAANLNEAGFNPGEQLFGDKYWIQSDVPQDEFVWEPKYASLEILGPEGDGNFDFVLNTFDPTSEYFPKNITYDWVKANIGSPQESAINDRCHLARESGFTEPSGTKPENATGITAECVYVGGVYYNSKTNKYFWTKNPGADLKGKIIYATNSRMRAYMLALQEGAVVSLCSQINFYNNPVIDGKELYPDTVQYANVPNTDAKNPVAFNLSPQDGRYLISVLENAKEPVKMKAIAIGDFYPYSEEKPLKTLVAEITGATKPDERVVFVAHVQEPGANDNATGIGLQLEVAKNLKRLIDEGKLPRPDRTFTFIWGAEYTSSYLWRNRHPDQMLNVKTALVLDMVGEDPAKTGGTMRIEKIPDPSAIYHYGLDTLPGGKEPAMTNYFNRKPDKHTLWGAGELLFKPYPGHFLNDLYFESASLVAKDFPSFQVGSNPYEGGSDHDPFIWHTENFTEENNVNFVPKWHPLPAIQTWHFTDYVYHSSMDTLDKVSKDELRNVGITTIGVGYLIAKGGEDEAKEIMRIVTSAAMKRFTLEMQNTKEHLNWAYNKSLELGHSPADITTSVENALTLELEILGAWATWYKEAVKSPGQLGGTALSIGYQDIEQAHIQTIDELLTEAVSHAKTIAQDIKKEIPVLGNAEGSNPR